MTIKEIVAKQKQDEVEVAAIAVKLQEIKLREMGL